MVKSETLVITKEKKTELNHRAIEATLEDKGHTKKLAN